MPKRSETLFKLLCAGIAAFLIYQLVSTFVHRDPLSRVNIPAVPTLAGQAETNSASGKPAAKPGTNAVSDTASAKATNKVAQTTNAPSTVAKTGTNPTPDATAATGTYATASNAVTSVPTTNQTTNALVRDTNSVVTDTNTIARDTNALAKTTNGSLVTRTGTNAIADSAKGTNRLAKGTNAVPRGTSAPGAGPDMAAMMPGRMGGPNRGPQTPVPPEIQARVDRIVESEILAPVPHPVPMGLLGIAGQSAFLRAPNGQTGLVKEGEELGGIKILEIGINRVLVQEDGQKKELTIFEGFGSESLLSKPQEKSPNETTKK
jgi:hypothetical protein